MKNIGMATYDNFAKVCTIIGFSLIVGISCAQLNTVASQDDTINNGTINMRAYGAAGDGETDDTQIFLQALEEIKGDGVRMEISHGRFMVSGITFPPNVELVFHSGGTLHVPAEDEIQINGSIEAGIRQIFSGDGTVKGQVDNLYIYPQWFGAKGDGVHDDASALQQAADLAVESLGNTLFIPDGEYLFGSDLVLRSNVESRGLLIKEMEIDEERTRFSSVIFVPTHYPKNNPHVIFAPDHEELELDAEYFQGIEEGDLEVPVFQDIPLADGSGQANLSEGGTLRFYSSNFFSSRNNQKGDQYYDKRDIVQVVSGRGDVFPEFAFSYPEPPSADEWQRNTVYEKGDYVSYQGEVFKATWPSGEGSVFEHPYLDTVNIGPVHPQPDKQTTRYDFTYSDGSEDAMNIWRRIDMRVWYRQKDRPLTVNGLRMEVRLKNHEGKSKRISAGAMTVNRSNMTFNNLNITVRDREATMARLLRSNNVVNLEFNNGYFSGATYHGLGYNILNTGVANVRYNDCVSANSRKGMDGNMSKNVTVNGGFYNVIDDHYGRNLIIRDAVLSGRSTNIPGYVTPDADLQAWHFRTIRPLGFTGGNLYVENVTVNEGSGGILSVRGDIGDLYGNIVMRDITIRRNDGDVRVVNHSIDPDFDFARTQRVPDQMIIENVSLENSGLLNLNIGSGFDAGVYGQVIVRNSGPIGEVYTSSPSIIFSDCRIEDGEFNTEPGSKLHFRNCIFTGTTTGLTKDNIGSAFGNVRESGAEISFPIEDLPEGY